jgi:MiaB/RimO family radical SAM methylthiotransferase
MRFAVKFLGCKVSHADAMLARKRLLEAGHVEASEEEAELHVINTCCITGEAEAKSRQSVRRSLKHAHEVYVSGCAANLHARQFAEIDPAVRPFTGAAEEVAAAMAGALGACVDLEHEPLLGRARKGSSPLLGRVGTGSRPSLGHAREGSSPLLGRAGTGSRPSLGHARDGSPSASSPSPYPSPSQSPSSLPPSGLQKRAPVSLLEAPSAAAARTRGFVKVQDGCDCHCAYCIIPTVRGGARSRPAEAVLEEVRARVAQGQPEVVMTGISVGDYRDPKDGLELGDLMVRAAAIDGVERVRLSSVEVIHVRDSLIEALCAEPKVCPHLHVPLQSGDDEVLSAMGRHYTAAEYLRAIDALRDAVPCINVTTDVIVGFPLEDEAAFERTLELVVAAGISKVHAFSYSPRPGTAAERLGDRVAPEEKKRRSRELRGLSEVRSRHHRAAKLGGTERVLVDKVAASQCAGYSADYTRCYLPGGAATAGELLDVFVGELHADGLRATPF